MDDLDPVVRTGGEVHRTARVGAGDDGCSRTAARPLDRVELARPDRRRQLGFGDRVGTTRAAAQPVVVELDHVGHRAEHGAHRLVAALDVAQVARILDDHPLPQRLDTGRGEDLVDARRQPLVDVQDPCAEVGGVGGAEQRAVLLERRTAPGGVDQDRGVARHRRHRALGAPARLVVPPGVMGERPAARAATVGDRERRPRRRDQRRRAVVRGTLPGVHHAAGEEPHVGPGGGEPRGASHRQPCEPEALRHETHALGHGEHRRPAEDHAVPSERTQPEPLPPRQRARCDRGTCGVDQTSVRDTGRARRFAAPALHTRRHELDEPRVERSAVALDGAHRVDPPARRQALLPRHPERRAVRQAQPAAHTGRQIDRIDLQRRSGGPHGRRS